ncbi:minor capsid protein [Halomonas sp. SIMBA_159]|uniref:minor capsid protein n=3 Tax=Pseudomonadota TaxID=1224 RepID=UPI0030D2CEE8
MIERAIVQGLKDSRVGFEKTPVFFNFMPETVNFAIMVDTPIPGFEIDPELPGYYNDIIEIVVRHSDPEAGFALCQKAMKVLNVTNQRFGDYHFNHVRPISEPTTYPISNGGLFEFAFRLEFSCYRLEQ